VQLSAEGDQTQRVLIDPDGTVLMGNLKPVSPPTTGNGSGNLPEIAVAAEVFPPRVFRRKSPTVE